MLHLIPSIRKVAGFCLALGLAVVVGGCSSSGTAERSIKFDSSSDTALVIMGMRSTRGIWAHYTVTWWPLDPATNRFAGTREQAATLHRSGMESYGAHGLTKMKYMIFPAAPGQYALHSTVFDVGSAGTYVKRYRPTASAFTVRPGEILYIGDFTFQLVSDGFLAKDPDKTKFVPTGRDDAAAQAALEDYANVSGKIIYRPLEEVRVQ